ncbi:hypothetical protein SprV_0602207300 [Sparganum proliferum]
MALVARELERYETDIAALNETRFSEQGHLQEFLSDVLEKRSIILIIQLNESPLRFTSEEVCGGRGSTKIIFVASLPWTSFDSKNIIKLSENSLEFLSTKMDQDLPTSLSPFYDYYLCFADSYSKINGQKQMRTLSCELARMIATRVSGKSLNICVQCHFKDF